MLDHVDFSMMSYDTVNWITEAEEAYGWASYPENQPDSHNNFSSDVKIYKLFAAVNLFRVTGKDEYQTAAKTILNELKASAQLIDDERWGVYAYLLANNQNTDKELQSELKTVALNTADTRLLDASEIRACRWGGVYDMPMLVGQGTTPLVLEGIIAYELSGNLKYKNAIHTTADYFLGSNPRHSTWITGVGPRPAACGFHLDSRYNHNWVVYPGFIPYGPWSMAYGVPAFTWVIDGVSVTGGMGPWDKDWANFSQYPQMTEWPGHERWNSNIHSPMSSENTIHQNTVYGGIAYGFVNSRQNTNASAAKKITALILGSSDIVLDAQGKDSVLTVTTDIHDATFAALKWKSSDPRVAYVDDFGRVTGVNSGTCTITVSTLDESITASCNITCSWAEVNVDQISINPDIISLVEGQKKNLTITFLPSNATNKFVDWTYTTDGIVSIDENGVLTAQLPGNGLAIATSLNSSKKDTCFIEVKEAVDYVIADFDVVVPVTTIPKSDSAQLYTPFGTNDIAFANPLKNEANSSTKVVKWGRPPGDWELLGMVLATDHRQDLSQYAQFRFKYFGSGIKDFYIQLLTDDESQIEITEPVKGEDCWQLFTYNLSTTKKLKQLNVFVNKTGNPQAITVYFDDFILAGKAMERFDDITISETAIELNSLQSATIIADAAGEPFTWVSSDPSVASVDQNGTVTAISGGTAIIKAVPLYGNPAECTVLVDGGIPIILYDIICDFETVVLDWNPYGAYGWSSDSVAIADNPLKVPENDSEKTLFWKKDLTFSLWGGYGFIIPTRNATGFDLFSFQLLATKTVETIRVEFYSGINSVGSYTLNNLGTTPNQWSEVTFDLADFSLNFSLMNNDFDKIQFQIAGGSDEEMLVYTDNILLRTAGDTIGTGISIHENNPAEKSLMEIEVFPNPFTELLSVSRLEEAAGIELTNILGNSLRKIELQGASSISIQTTDLQKGIYLLRIVYQSGQQLTKKIIKR